MPREEDYQGTAAEIMPAWSFWGAGVVLVKQEQWQRSQNKIASILKQLHKTKERIKENRAWQEK